MYELPCLWCGKEMPVDPSYIYPFDPTKLRTEDSYVCSCGVVYSKRLLHDADPKEWMRVKEDRREFSIEREGDMLIITQHHILPYPAEHVVINVVKAEDENGTS